MPRRQSLAHQACELCRQKKRKCNGDGLNPCRACHESGAHCVYFAATRVSKADLRQELARLQSINSDNSTLLDAISSRDTSPAQLSNILQRLSDGQSRAEVAVMLTQQPDSRSPATSAPTTASPMSPGSRLSITQESFKSSVPSVMTPPTVKSPSETHLQANIGYYRQQLPQLLDAILARDCLSFCPISKPDFARDFESGSGEHFSTALADALLALATLLAREQMVAIIASRSSSSSGGGGGGDDDVREQDLGYSFAQEAIAALYNGAGLPHRIADIQALGILALYCLGCAKMKDSLGFAGDFGAAIAEQWGANQSESVLAHRQTHANIYCAAVSFNSKTIDELAVKVGVTRPPFQSSSSTDGSGSKTNLSGTIIDDAFFTRDLSLLPNNSKVIAAKLFGFTEWVYKARFSPEKTLDQAVKVYQDSLQWYESFFAYTSSCTAETPLILFGQ
ncbi:Conidial development protein fluffy [Beauveria bassiana]|uniref:Conidial development protein fluffy n=1 Tax=Beauveria bassiana TaxID=176275 RepID=A0A2N6NHS7_BEABA|nr:Conidial development protein fluffy [Beauveria bassiana]